MDISALAIVAAFVVAAIIYRRIEKKGAHPLIL
jgi:hypothetical protein